MARRGLLAMLLTALALIVALPADFGHAQQQQRRGLLEMLFGPRVLQPRPQQQLFGQPPRKQRNTPAEPAVPAVEAVAKNPDAKKVLVVGDFVAGGLAWGLEQTFAEQAGLVVVDRANSASGLVRDDYYDWNAELLKILNEEKPDFVVVAVGSNDRQQIRSPTGRLAPRSEGWKRRTSPA